MVDKSRTRTPARHPAVLAIGLPLLRGAAPLFAQGGNDPEVVARARGVRNTGGLSSSQTAGPGCVIVPRIGSETLTATPDVRRWGSPSMFPIRFWEQ